MPANGMSGQAPIPSGVAGGGLFADIYAVSITSGDGTAIEAVTLDSVLYIGWD